MSLLIQYDFSSSSFRGPNIIRNTAPGDTSYIYNGTMVNNPAINSAGVTTQSSSVLFNSSQQQYIKVPAFNTTNSGMTFTFWFKSNNNNTWARIFDFGNGPGSNNILAFVNNGYLGFSVYLGGNAYQPTNVIPNINNNIWTHVAWTLTYPNGWNIYVNGTLYTNFSAGYYPNTVFKNLNYIGKSNWNDPYFNGNIADFRMYNSVLTAADITGIYNNDKSTLNVKSGNAVLNTGFNELYNQIFCDLFTTNSGFNQCQNCNYGQTQEIYSTTTQVGEQNCLKACQDEPHCTSYSYDTTASTNNCKQYVTFPSEILNGANGINSGYSLGKYSYNFSDLSSSQKSNAQDKCVGQYLNNYFTPDKQIDVIDCLKINTSGNDTNIVADPACIYNTYTNNGITPKIVNNSVYNTNPNYNLTYKGDTTIDNYRASYSDYSNDLVNISNINNKMSYTLSQNDNNYNDTVSKANNNLYNEFKESVIEKTDEMTSVLDNALSGVTEKFENKIINDNYSNSGKLIGLLIIIFLIFFAIYSFKKK